MPAFSVASSWRERMFCWRMVAEAWRDSLEGSCERGEERGRALERLTEKVEDCWSSRWFGGS
jgi:hypothetical protein